MSRIVRCSLIQAKNEAPVESSLASIKQAMIDKHVAMIRQAAADGAQIVCLQEIFYGPYFCAEQIDPLVRLHRAGPRRPDDPAHAVAGKRAWHRADRAGLRGRAAKASTTTLPRSSTTTGIISANIARRTSRMSRLGFGRSSTSAPAIWVIRSSISASPRLASTSATTAIFPRARAPSA